MVTDEKVLFTSVWVWCTHSPGHCQWKPNCHHQPDRQLELHKPWLEFSRVCSTSHHYSHNLLGKLSKRAGNIMMSVSQKTIDEGLVFPCCLLLWKWALTDGFLCLLTDVWCNTWCTSPILPCTSSQYHSTIFTSSPLSFSTIGKFVEGTCKGNKSTTHTNCNMSMIEFLLLFQQNSSALTWTAIKPFPVSLHYCITVSNPPSSSTESKLPLHNTTLHELIWNDVWLCCICTCIFLWCSCSPQCQW